MRILFSIAVTEWRRFLAYRVDFWIQLVAASAVHMAAAFFLWQAIYNASNSSSMKGYHFHEMMLYYLTVTLVDRAVRTSDRGLLSTEIYEGSLSRLLLYPVGILHYGSAVHLSRSAFYSIQIIGIIMPLSFILYSLSPFVFSVRFILAFVCLFSAAYLYFIICSIVESVAFWADHVWSLLVMLRFLIFFCGGGLIPLAFFPGWFTDVIRWTPFPYLLADVVSAMTMQLNSMELIEVIARQCFFSAICFLILSVIWRMGRRHYSGVGQ